MLRGLDLVVPGGTSVALVGATGSGKSTLARLIARFYDVDGGRVLLDGVDVRDLRLDTLRRSVGIVFEDTFLFTDTVYANIALAEPSAPPERVEAAARLAGAADFIAHLPDGYDTVLGEQGYSLSGGQRQRVAIARAILADPRVLVLDDATSAVDPTKEHQIRDALRQVMQGRTTIVIAHREATVALADRVVLLDGGVVVAEGTHTELLAASPRYRQVLARGDRVVAAPEAARPMKIPDATDVDLSTSDKRRILRRTWRFLRPHRAGLAAIGVLVVLQATGTIAGPALVRYGIDEGVRRGDEAALTRAGVLFLFAAVLAYVSGRAAIRAVARVGEAFLRELRERVFSHQMSLSLDFYDRNRTGSLVARMTADIEALQELIGQGLTMFIVNSLLLVGAVVVMVGMSWQLALGTLLVVPFVAKATSTFRRESNRAYLHLRESIGTSLSTIQEGLAGVRVVQAFNQELAMVERFSGTNEQLFGAHMRTERIAARYFPVWSSRRASRSRSSSASAATSARKAP